MNPRWLTIDEAGDRTAVVLDIAAAEAIDRLQELWTGDAIKVCRVRDGVPQELSAAASREIDLSDARLWRSGRSTRGPYITYPDTDGIRLDVNPRAVNPGYMSADGSPLAPDDLLLIDGQSLDAALKIGENGSAPASTGAGEKRARQWLSDEVKSGRKRKSKAEYRNEARRLFGTSDRGFNERVWPGATAVGDPEVWNKPGRIPKS